VSEILLDENLDMSEVEEAIHNRWRKVQNIKRIRPGIKDEDIPEQILQRRPGCVFVTIDPGGFWRKIPGDARYAIVCVELPNNLNSEKRRVPILLARLVRLPPFQTDAGRRGKVFKITKKTYEYYSRLTDLSQPEPWPRPRKRSSRL
jgi:hypothetical protein